MKTMLAKLHKLKMKFLMKFWIKFLIKIVLVDLQVFFITGLLKEEMTSKAEPVDHVEHQE